MSRMSEYVRKSFKMNDEIRDAGLTTPADVVRYDDILYGSDEVWQRLDVYRPAEAEGKTLPVIVSVHGGGFVYGDKELYQYYCMNLAQKGFAVVNFTYRLAPEFLFPAAMEDTNLVFSWVLAHAKEYGMDAGRVFAVGDSAGANLLGLYTAACTNPAYAASYAFSVPEGFCPRAVALNCGVYCPQIVEGRKDMMSELLKEYLPQGGTQEELEQITLPAHVASDFPPVFLMTAANDFLKEEALTLAKKLTEENVLFRFHFYTGHSFSCGAPAAKAGTSGGEEGQEAQPGHVFHLNMRSSLADQCNTEECAFFRQFFEE
ncbi:MAG: alpha/beta hydrolase [Ruminococcus sp.]|nr:alpha/beta hydrolase [Ruminococcus sp.]